MEYLKPSFTVDLGSKKYQDHYDCVFNGKKCVECELAGCQDCEELAREVPDQPRRQVACGRHAVLVGLLEGSVITKDGR